MFGRLLYPLQGCLNDIYTFLHYLTLYIPSPWQRNQIKVCLQVALTTFLVVLFFVPKNCLIKRHLKQGPVVKRNGQRSRKQMAILSSLGRTSLSGDFAKSLDAPSAPQHFDMSFRGFQTCETCVSSEPFRGSVHPSAVRPSLHC